MESSITSGAHILQLSCNKNKEMLDLLNLLEINLNSSNTKVLGILPQRIKMVQQEIVDLDDSFIQYRKRGAILTKAEEALLIEKTVSQEKMYGINSNLVQRINTVKAALAGEMQSLKHGRKAMSGYGAKINQGGRLINKSM